MTNNKKQHYIPASYLAAWCDKNTPQDQTPYIWKISKDGKTIENKSPYKTFIESDLYTIIRKDGERDLQIEYTLSKLEDKFVKLRNKVDKHIQIDNDEFYYICMYISAMKSRTLAFKNHQSKSWQKVIDLGVKMANAMEHASPEERERMAKLGSRQINGENYLTMDEVKELVDDPIKMMMPTHILQLSPELFQRPFLILESIIEDKFITSDDPCVWWDPASYIKPKPFGAGGLISPSLEITFPLSPTKLVIFGNGPSLNREYLPVNNSDVINNINRRTRHFASEYIVSSSAMINPIWFT
jgi:hypothetical protein